jgi:hypothetical protein
MTNDIFRSNPLFQNQFAYQSGKSTETALHNVVTHTENAAEYNETSLVSFLKMEGACDKISFETMVRAAEQHGVEPPFTGRLAPCWKAGT